MEKGPAYGLPEEHDEDQDGCCSICTSKKENQQELAQKGYYGHIDEDPTRPPGSTPHSCTDIPCLIVFIAALSAIGCIIYYCTEKKADIRKLYHGYNFLGELCGFDGTGNPGQISDLTGKKYLFWCENDVGALDLAHPVCVPSCPTNAETSTACYDYTKFGPHSSVVGDTIDNQVAGTGSFQQENTYMFKNVPNYPSKVLLGSYCYPANHTLANELMSYLRENPGTKMLTEAVSVDNAWPLFLCAAILALILGFLYLKFLEHCAKCLVYTSLGCLCIIPLAFSGIFIYSANHEGGMDGLLSSGDQQWDWIIGISCGVLGLIFCVMAFCAGNAIKVAIGVVKAACEALTDMPTLLLEPVVTQTVRAIVFFLMMLGLMYLLSCGTMTTMTLEQYSVLPTTGVNGIFRTFQYTEDEIYMILYYIFMIFWVMCIFTALSQFALAYAIQKWYFTPYENDDKQEIACCPIVAGYKVGMIFHMGSFAFGSFIVAVLMFIRMILSYIANQQSGAGGNPVAAGAAKACACCVDCFERCIRFLNKNAYMDIALNSKSFCFAARNAFRIIIENAPEMVVLNGACWVFQIAGVGAISCIGTLLVYLIMENVEYFNDPASDHYIADPVGILIITQLIGIMIAYAFMTVFDMAADTMLYCFCNEEIRRKRGLIPPDVRYAPYELDKRITAHRTGVDGSETEFDEDTN